MKKVFFACVSAILLSIGCNAFAQKCPPNCTGVTTPVPVGRLYDLKIVSIEPAAALVEHQDITVAFELTVKKYGVVGELKSQQGQVCGVNHRGTCKTIAQLDPDRTYNGQITITAPAAAKNADIAIVLEAAQVCPPGVECFGTETLAEGHSIRPVAADYVVNIDSFTIRHTRAVHEDTLEMNLSAQVPGQRSAEKGACDFVPKPPTYCVTKVKQGDYNNGTYPAKGSTVGLYRLIPEVEPEFTFEYHLINLGTPYEQRAAEKIFNGISDAAAAFMSAYTSASGGSGGGDAWKQVNDFTHKLNALQFGGCDGPVLVGAAALRNQALPGGEASTLDAVTKGTGRYTNTQHSEDYDEINSQDGCGKSPRYDVTYSIVRTTWQPWP